MARRIGRQVFNPFTDSVTEPNTQYGGHATHINAALDATFRWPNGRRSHHFADSLAALITQYGEHVQNRLHSNSDTLQSGTIAIALEFGFAVTTDPPIRQV